MSLTSTVAQRRSTVEQLELRNLLASDGFMGSELPDGAPLTAEVAETLTELSILPLAESVERGDPQSSFDGRQVQSASRRSDEASASGTDSDSSVEDPTPVGDVPVDASPVDGQPADEEPVSEEPVDPVDDEPVDEAPIDATPSEDDEEPVPGDANGDGQIGFADFLIVSEYFGKTDAVFEEGDFDGDGTVAFNDFLYVANFFDADSIPEGRRPRDGSGVRVRGLKAAAGRGGFRIG